MKKYLDEVRIWGPELSKEHIELFVISQTREQENKPVVAGYSRTACVCRLCDSQPFERCFCVFVCFYLFVCMDVLFSIVFILFWGGGVRLEGSKHPAVSIFTFNSFITPLWTSISVKNYFFCFNLILHFFQNPNVVVGI